jgi:hypothetical protein
VTDSQCVQRDVACDFSHFQALKRWLERFQWKPSTLPKGLMLVCLGAVIGATIDPTATAIIDRLPQSLILAPGVGTQGAEMPEVGTKFRNA